MAGQIDKDRFTTMGQCYDQMAPFLVPQYDFLQSQLLTLALAEVPAPACIVDLGAGSGRFIERALSACPGARAVWVDSSADFLAVAQRRLERFAGRVQFVQCRLEEPWEAQLAGPADAVFSMSAIHHLASDDKRRLYRRCLDVLRPGGWLFNADEMSTLHPDAYRRTLLYWVRHVDQAKPAVPAELAGPCAAWCERFEKWKQRNVEGMGAPKQRGDDVHEGFVEQLAWLRESGFVNVDLFVKFQLWSIIGGQRPDADRKGGGEDS